MTSERDHLFFLIGEKPGDTKVENLLMNIEKYALASHLLWGLWGIISVSCFMSLVFSVGFGNHACSTLDDQFSFPGRNM